MSELEAFISPMRHKTCIEVNAAGTEAAAATALVTTSMPPDDPFELVVDRPFLGAICDRNTGGLLFGGATVDPR